MRTPLKIDDAFDLQALLSLQAHARQLVDTDLLSRCQPGSKLVVCAPLEGRPGHLLPRALALRVDRGESAQQMARLDVPDSNIVALVLRREKPRALWHVLCHDDGLMGPGHKVLFARRKIDETDEGVEETSLELEGGASI